MKNKLFILIAIVAVAGAILFIFSGGESEKKKTTDGKTTEVDDSDDGRTEVALTYTVKEDGPSADRGVKMLASAPRKTPTDFALTNAKFSKDIDKVMKSVSGLSTSGKTAMSAMWKSITVRVKAPEKG